ncbi:MAG: guanylate kinase [Oscillospiraceae bacterium]|nr:guanylate kinase [Oscillospiraceae bacterium]MBR7010427.1 guanylate kinase [Oscillospiraceae bacterium]
MKKGRLIVISGPSGVGKGTVVKALRERDPNVKLSVSATTREIRPGEIDGVHYYFITHEKFEQMIAEDRFLEHAQYVGNRYGTPAAPVNRMLEEGYDVILEIEVQGGLQVLERRPDAISVFIAAPSFEVLGARLRGRGDTDEEKVLMRLQQARMEYLVAKRYQYIVVNDRLEDAVADLQAILRAEALKTEHQEHLLKEDD